MKNCSVLAETLAEVVEQDIYEYIQQIPANEEYVFSPEFEKKMQKLINNRKKTYFNLICTTSRKAACIAAACMILCVGTLNAEALGQFCDFIVKHFQFHDEVTLSGNSDLTTEIATEYMLCDIPEGFELKDYQKEKDSIYYSYKNDDNGFIAFFQYDQNNYICRFDTTRFVQSEYTDENGTEYLIYKRNHSYSFVWKNEEYVFEIHSNLSEQEIINLAESLSEKQ